MRKLILAILLALVCAAPITTVGGCAALQQQYEDLHSMEQVKFDKLLVQVESVARIGGREVGKRIERAQTRAYVVTILELALKQDTQAAFIEVVDALKVVPEYKQYIIPGLLMAFDLIEAASGTPFTLDAHVHPRDLALIRALLRGLKDGVTTLDN